MFLRRYPLLSFFVLAYALTWAIELPMMYAARGVMDFHLPAWLEALAAFGPFLAAVIVLGGSGTRELWASLLRWRVAPVWWLVTLGSPFVVMLAALFMTGEANRFFSGELLAAIREEGRLFEVIVLGGLLRGVGEEPGWRGMALPMLRERFNPLWATLLLWPVWTLWHLPAFLMRPDFALGAWIGFSLGLLAAAALLTLIYDHTKSVLLAAVWHALINICRTIAGQASTDAFFAFAQAMLLIGVAIILYWIVTGRLARTRNAET